MYFLSYFCNGSVRRTTATFISFWLIIFTYFRFFFSYLTWKNCERQSCQVSPSGSLNRLSSSRSSRIWMSNTSQKLLQSKLSLQPLSLATSIVKPHLTCHFNSVMKSSRKQPRPLLWITNGPLPLCLSSRKRSLGQHLNKSSRFLFKFRVIHNTSANGSLTYTYTDLFCDGQQKLFNIITKKLLVTINIGQALR